MLFSPLLQSRKRHGKTARTFRPRLEPLESLVLLSFADGNGPVVTAITEVPGSKQLVITFDGPLNPGPAQNASNYQVTKALANPELVTKSGATDRIIATSYSDTSASQVTLTLKSSLKPGVPLMNTR